MNWMALIALIVFTIVFVVGAIPLVLSLLHREPRFKARRDILGLALVLIGIGSVLQWFLGYHAFLAQLANIFGGIGLAWALAFGIKRNKEQNKTIELGLGLTR